MAGLVEDKFTLGGSTNVDEDTGIDMETEGDILVKTSERTLEVLFLPVNKPRKFFCGLVWS